MPVPLIVAGVGGVLLGGGRVALSLGARGLIGATSRGLAGLRGGLGVGRRDLLGRDHGKNGAPPFRTDMRVRGLADTRRALRRVDKAADDAIKEHLRELAVTVAGRARARAPVRTGRLQRSIRPSVTVRKGAAVTSRLPYANVHEWGGTIRPRGVPITIAPSRMITGAVAESDALIENALHRIGDEIERAWKR